MKRAMAATILGIAVLGAFTMPASAAVGVDGDRTVPTTVDDRVGADATTANETYLQYYASLNGSPHYVNYQEVQYAIDDWQRDRLSFERLQVVIDYWARGEYVNGTDP